MPRTPRQRGLNSLATAVAQAQTSPARSVQAAREAAAAPELAAGSRIDALKAQAIALMNQGDILAARESIQQAIGLAQTTGDRHREARCHINLGVMQSYAGVFADALSSFGRAIALSGPTSELTAMACNNLGLLAVQMDENQLAFEFFAITRLHAKDPQVRGVAALNAGMALSRLDRVTAAMPYLREAVKTLHSGGDLSYKLNARAVKAWADAYQGHTTLGVEELQQLHRQAVEAGLASSEMKISHLLVEALVMAGQPQRAVEMGQAVLEDTRLTPLRAKYRELHLAMAEAWKALGRPEQSHHHLDCYVKEGKWAMADEGRARLRREMFELMAPGAGPLAVLRPGRYVAQRGPAERFGLSSDETAVLLQLCDGSTNPQIARTLGQSVFTVRNRLSRVMRKLGVASRTALVPRALELGVVVRESAAVA